MGIRAQVKQFAHAWNAFNSPATDDIPYSPGDYAPSYSRPSRTAFPVLSERSIIASINTRLAIDAASIELRHVRLDEQDRYDEDIKSGLSNCLRVEANLDQAARQFRQDVFMTLLEEGVAIIVPVDTTLNPAMTGGYDIKTMRVGTPVSWYPSKIKVRLYNDKTGKHEEVVVDKSYCAVLENPLYLVMNEPNSTLRRLIRKLNILDVIDEQSGSGKLDLIIQLPYVIKSEARRASAEQRRKDIEVQLKGSQYGIAYTDGTEKVTQLNRPSENNLLKQVEYLMTMLYSQLGLTEEVMNGTADEKTMLNYYNRTIEPLIKTIVEAMHRSFLTSTARAQGQAVIYLRDPFKLVPISEVAEIADKFIRNRVATSNDMRSAIGWRPSSDPSADKLDNPNMPIAKQITGTPSVKPDPAQPEGVSQNGS